MQEKRISSAAAGDISDEQLRAFAKGQLDEATEERIIAILETRPDLAAKIAAISSDSVVKNLQPSFGVEQSRVDLDQLSDFKILKEIGRGGMGIVYLAKHQISGRKEVLKVLNERLAVHSEARKRFDQEIRCIATMNHENIVRCHTVRQLRSSVVLCMEYIPGTNLHQFVLTNGPLPLHVACGIAVEVCRGLQHAMDHGLVHRDIKPSNIMLYKSEGKIKAKILDFGLARLGIEGAANPTSRKEGLTDAGILLGTLEYISPEQCLDAASADIRSDIYSLGCTLFHMLIGSPPFSGSTGQLILAHGQQQPPSMILQRPDIPAELQQVIDKMLAKSPEKRFASPDQVAQALTPFVKRRKVSLQNNVSLQTSDNRKSNPEIVNADDTSIDNFVFSSNTTVEQDSVADGILYAEPVPGDLPVNDALLPSAADAPKFPRNRRAWIMAASAAFFMSLLALAGIVVIKTKDGTIRITGVPQDAEVTFDPSGSNEPKSIASITRDDNAPPAEWNVLFDGTRSSFYNNLIMRQRCSKCDTEFNSDNELHISTGPGEADFVSFHSKSDFDPNRHIVIKFKNYNGSPKVFGFARHIIPGKPSIYYSVTLGGMRKTKPQVPIMYTGSVMAAPVNAPGSDFNIRASRYQINPGESYRMDLIAYEGRVIVKLNGETVNDFTRSNTNFIDDPISFWTKRSSQVSFSEIKIKELKTDADFTDALASTPT